MGRRRREPYIIVEHGHKPTWKLEALTHPCKVCLAECVIGCGVQCGRCGGRYHADHKRCYDDTGGGCSTCLEEGRHGP